MDELLEEGESFEADAVKGVEDAGDEGEVHTHEVPEDDVPDEYLDNEKGARLSRPTALTSDSETCSQD